LENLGNKKSEIIDSATESYHSFMELSSLVNEKLARLENLEKIYKTTATSIKKVLGNNLVEGEKINTVDYQISWRKSSSIEIDELMEPVDIETS
jgi:predicted phage-related endonuclease